jgi:hypothetical protein
MTYRRTTLCADTLAGCDHGNHGFVARCGHGAARRKELEQINASYRRADKFIFIWLCLFAPLSLNEQMKTSATAITNTFRAVPIMLSLLCAGLLVLSLGGCAGTYYAESSAAPESRVNTHYGPYYYPYYPWYAYYGGAYYYGVIR